MVGHDLKGRVETGFRSQALSGNSGENAQVIMGGSASRVPRRKLFERGPDLRRLVGPLRLPGPEQVRTQLGTIVGGDRLGEDVPAPPRNRAA